MIAAVRIFALVATAVRENPRVEIAASDIDDACAGTSIDADELCARIARVCGCLWYVENSRVVFVRALLEPRPCALPRRRACVCPRAFAGPRLSCCFL